MKHAKELQIKSDIVGIITSILVGLMFTSVIVATETLGKASEIPLWVLFLIIVVQIICIEVLVFSIIQLKRKLDFIANIRNNSNKKEVDLFKEELKQFSRLETRIITSQVPIILVVPFVWLFVHGIKTGASVGTLILTGIGIVFLISIFATMIYSSIRSKVNSKHMENLESVKLAGKLEQVYVPYLTPYKNKVYCLRISYEEKGKKKEFMTPPDYSRQFVSYLNKLEYIPLISNNYGIIIDRKEVGNVPKNNDASDIDFYNLECLTDNKNQAMKTNSLSKKPRHTGKSEHLFNIVGYFLSMAVFLILMASGIFALWTIRHKFDLSVCISACVLMVSGLIGLILYNVEVLHLSNKKMCANFGKNDFANSFKILKIKELEEDLQIYNVYTIKYDYYDENHGLHHNKENVVLDDTYKSDMSNLDRLHIKIYKKYAIINFDKLTNSLYEKRNIKQ